MLWGDVVVEDSAARGFDHLEMLCSGSSATSANAVPEPLSPAKISAPNMEHHQNHPTPCLPRLLTITL